jgi:hypothetical protein
MFSSVFSMVFDPENEPQRHRDINAISDFV